MSVKKTKRTHRKPLKSACKPLKSACKSLKSACKSLKSARKSIRKSIRSPRIPRFKLTRSKKRYCILLGMYIGTKPERRAIYENRAKKWLDNTSIDIYTVDSSGELLFTSDTDKKYFNHPRLHQYTFKQKGSQVMHGPSVAEKNSMIKAFKHFKKDFEKYEIVFKITGKYFIPTFEKVVDFPEKVDMVFQYRRDTHGQNTEVIGFSPMVFKEIVTQINDDTTIEELSCSIRKGKMYRTHRLPKMKLDQFTKRSDGSTLKYLF
jgi:hypothetical protein